MTDHSRCDPVLHDRSLGQDDDPNTTADDGQLGCADCGRPAYYCLTTDTFQHVDPNASCFLIQ